MEYTGFLPVTPSRTNMDTFSRAVDDLLMIATIVMGGACVGMFVTALMASARICRLTKRLKKRDTNDASQQKHQLRNVFQGRVIEFYVPDNFRTNRQGEIGAITGALAAPLRGKPGFPLAHAPKEEKQGASAANSRLIPG
jgi:hypothetical protein